MSKEQTREVESQLQSEEVRTEANERCWGRRRKETKETRLTWDENDHGGRKREGIKTVEPVLVSVKVSVVSLGQFDGSEDRPDLEAVE